MRTPLFCVITLFLLARPASAEDSVARAHVQAALEAMGGEARLRNLGSLRLQGVGHWNLLEQSERPTPPFLVAYEQFDEVRDLRRSRLRQRCEARGAPLPTWTPLSQVYVDGVAALERDGQLRPAGTAQAQDLRERLDTAPERVLLVALDATDLRAEPDAVMQDVPHHVVAFRQAGARVRLFLNAHTALPTAVERVEAHPEDLFWNIWGDVRTVLTLQSWSLEPGGLRYPRAWDWERNGVAYHSQTVTAVTLEAPLDEKDFALPEAVTKGFAERASRTLEGMAPGLPGSAPIEVAPGVVQLPGRWNVALVQQEDGIVVLEAPLTSGYSTKVLEEVARRFPGQKVKAVVATSDAWPHIGGLREYAARGTPVQVLDLNRPLVERLMKAPRLAVPDALARAPRAAKLQSLSRRTALGTGKNRMELIPVRTETGERMLFAWLPEHHLLYTSDLVQPAQAGGLAMPQQLSETQDVAAREKLEVGRIFGMHLGPTDWATLAQAVEQARAPTAPPAPPSGG
ncbi:MBL fold metallo-hydrolase [Corallococcus sp. M34]|uniref:MBL fold metallo-hydrolase n=1 Tax=Citreicoccus inhibens TaxID=2849499 RepID=UPI001C219BD5|nr:MBL fold metallo-hydrolase [Citreicoccus inhibens]MBU8898404.1 MBL fold metallo-hydrolase [Citreicoccus inhibens]